MKLTMMVNYKKDIGMISKNIRTSNTIIMAVNLLTLLTLKISAFIATIQALCPRIAFKNLKLERPRKISIQPSQNNVMNACVVYENKFLIPSPCAFKIQNVPFVLGLVDNFHTFNSASAPPDNNNGNCSYLSNASADMGPLWALA